MGRRRRSGLACLLLAATLARSVAAAPRLPADDEVVERLPRHAIGTIRPHGTGASGVAAASTPWSPASLRDPGLAVEGARALLAQARAEGDARYAGRALGALREWHGRDRGDTPPNVLVMRADVLQFIHDFDGAEADLRASLARRPGDAQAWILLATLHRVQGDYARSDGACRGLARSGPVLYARACLAENQGLRGEFAAARQTFEALIADVAGGAAPDAGARQWLLTSLAELEVRAGRASAAEAAFRLALAARPVASDYLRLAYADHLLTLDRPGQVPRLLDGAPRSDAVLLRLALAQHGDPDTSAARELRQRFAVADLRDGADRAHARERAWFALEVDRDAARALAFARRNCTLQREPVDLLLLVRAAAQTGDAGALQEAKALVERVGLRDARIDALR